MKFNEYVEQIKRTLPDLGTSLVNGEFINSLHMTLGIVSETHELIMAFELEDPVNIREELIDKLWYVANYIYVNNLKIPHDVGIGFDYDYIKYIELDDEIIPKKIFEIYNTDNDYYYHYNILVLFEGILVDIDKKFLAYQKERDKELMNKVANNIIFSIHNIFKGRSENMNIAMKNNIAKLYKRYSKKFNNKDAVIRDLIAERKELEK